MTSEEESPFGKGQPVESTESAASPAVRLGEVEMMAR
jgi:hypothetical protein